MEVGDVVADAHDGLAVKGYKTESHIKIRCDGSSAIVQAIISQAMPMGHMACTNKHIVIANEALDGSFKGIYSYDDMYFGMVVYREKDNA